MYRQPGRSQDPDRAKLEEMAREGRARRGAERKVKDEQAAVADAEVDKEQRREADAIEWRFAQRASRRFSVLVTLQLALGFAVMFGAMWLFELLIDGDFVRVRNLVIGMAATGLTMLGLRQYLRRAQRTVIADERGWARDHAFGLTGHPYSVGTPVGAAELRIVVTLERAIPSGDYAVYVDAGAAVAPKGSVTIGKRKLAIESGELPTRALMPWTRDVVRRFVPTLDAFGVRGLAMTIKHETMTPGDLD